MRRRYVVASLLGASLLFLVQPMAAKLLLPVLGGTPEVWNTCMVFFQAALLGGYAYAHLLTTRLPPRAQAVVHLVLVAVAAVALPPALPAEPPSADTWPVGWLLLALLRCVGLPFFVLATTGPLVQRWLSAAGGKGADDPYPLYAAGNVGSFGALLAYPLLVEPSADLRTQRLGWSAAFGLYALTIAVCALPLLTGRATAARIEAGRDERIGWPRRLQWLALAFLPSSAMLGVTQYLTTDVAPVPLLWVVPLALYLLTFVLAFSSMRVGSARTWGWVLALFAVPAAAGFAVYSRKWGYAFPPFHLVALFALGMLCHGRLASDRPAPSRLTEFYLLIAVGGVLGGTFNALVAPVVFDSVAEYPIVLAAACALRALLVPSARGSRRRTAWALDVAAPVAVLLAYWAGQAENLQKVVQKLDYQTVWLGEVVLPAAACLVFAFRPLGFALAYVVLAALCWTQGVDPKGVLHAERTFFGVTRVQAREGPPIVHPDLRRWVQVPYHVLYHGYTRHGIQAQVPELRDVPTSYFHPSGPIGRTFLAFRDQPRMDHVAILGLGVGTLAAYGRPGQTMTIYELDPEVVRVASDPRFFTYVSSSRARVEVVLGDGRQSLARAPDGRYGLLVMDAFSSDAVPVHLLTREALAVYLRKLRPDGILAIHVTNLYLDLVPVVEALAADAGLTGAVFRDTVDDERQMLEGKDVSTWVLLARDLRWIDPVATSRNSRPLDASPRRRFLWTDSFSNLWSVFTLDPNRRRG